MSRRAPALLVLALPLLLGARVRAEGEASQQPAPHAAVLESDVCANCHSNVDSTTAMRDAAGRAIAPYDLWRSTMMANAARDPFWRASVAAEVALAPGRRRAIEGECLSCHAPMAHRVGLDDGGTGSLMHVLASESRLGDLARDGASCSVCHGISPEGLGTEASYSGRFLLDGERRLFGPHASPFPMPMRNAIQFEPTQSAHVLSAALCGTCHTLVTDALDARGEPTGERFLEQAPYLEWRNSDYCDEGEPRERAASCHVCHMPTHSADGVAIRTRIARHPMGFDFPPTEPRSPFGRHLLVGGNALVLSILRANREELGVLAPDAAFEATIQATREQLSQRTARVEVRSIEREAGRLDFDVAVTNLAGHKLPSAHPSRRVWLRVVVRDASGRVLFASGEHDAQGRVVDGAGVPLPSELAGGPIEPHRDRVRASNEFASYEAILADVDGAPTHRLMRGASFLRDDRLLPIGWRPEHAEAARTAPVGLGDDRDFTGGSDLVHYELEAPGGALEIEATLFHQSISARWAAELFRLEAPEIAAFRRMYEAAELAPEALASDRAALR